MSLAYASCSKSRLLRGNLRAFQTLSAPATARSRDNNGRNGNALVATPTVVKQWSMTSFNQAAANVRVLSLSTVSKLVSSSSLTTRSMASVSGNQEFRDGKPTLAYAQKLTKTFASMTNDQILHFAELGIPEACRECIVRDVMHVDQVEYDEAMLVFNKIAETNREGMFLAALPSWVGLSASVTLGYASIPLTFNLTAVEWFNEHFVTSEFPPPQDLKTWLEVGAASWGWMEPVLGQISFFLLSMQFARSQLKNLGIRPLNNWNSERRAARLVRKYPQYNVDFLMNYSKVDRLVKPHAMGH